MVKWFIATMGDYSAFSSVLFLPMFWGTHARETVSLDLHYYYIQISSSRAYRKLLWYIRILFYALYRPDDDISTEHTGLDHGFLTVLVHFGEVSIVWTDLAMVNQCGNHLTLSYTVLQPPLHLWITCVQCRGDALVSHLIHVFSDLWSDCLLKYQLGWTISRCI